MSRALAVVLAVLLVACAAREAGPGTDFHALERGVVSVTPLQVDLTHGNQIAVVGDWISK